MNSNVAESFWDWCHVDSVERVFEVTFSYFSILRFFMIFCDFRVSVFGYRGQNENPEITENLYFTVFFLKLYQIGFSVCLSLFLLAEFVSVISVVSTISEFSTWPLITINLSQQLWKQNLQSLCPSMFLTAITKI